MKQITKILETLAQKRGIAMDALYEQVDIVICERIKTQNGGAS